MLPISVKRELLLRHFPDLGRESQIKYQDTLRRLTFESKSGGEDLSYTRLENKIRDLFKLPVQAQIRLTYNDKDDDVITMADDQDLVDALIMQCLNPLRLHVSLVEPASKASVLLPSATVAAPSHVFVVEQRQQQPVVSTETSEQSSDVPSKQILKGLPYDCESTESVKKVLTSYERSLKDAATAHQVSELLEMIMKTVTQISSAVKNADVGSKPIFADMFASRPSTSPESINPESITGSISLLPSTVRPAEACSFSRTKSDSNEALELKNASRILHSGVHCDVCGISPIAGPRFKSIKRHDYDLCLSCFNEIGNAADFTRIERPLYRPRHLHSLGSGRMRCPVFNPNFHSGRPMSTGGPYGSRPENRCYHGSVHQITGGVYGGKLDARFVQDVTILDGTELTPGTHFTKIWRLRNSGTLPWAPQTKLVHVGGDELGSIFVVPLELPEHGLLPDQEVEAAVDLVAPAKPGRYVSHWRLASPAGPKFGHRVWVLIQVASKEKTSSNGKDGVDTDVSVSQEEIIRSTTLLPAEVSSGSRDAFVKASHKALVTEQQVEIRHPAVDIANSYVDVEEPFSGLNMADEKVATNVKGDHPVAVAPPEVKEEVLTENHAQEDVVAVESSELGGVFSMVEMPPNTVGPVNTPLTIPRGESDNLFGTQLNGNVDGELLGDLEAELTTAEVLSLKLEARGFTDRKLNVELLSKHKLDLGRTLDDLCAAAEWDPILEELEEMGFYDTEMNRRLMFKNNGSVKRVVKELVQMYKEPAGKRKEAVIE